MTYELCAAGSPALLEPAACDVVADVALLRCRAPLAGAPLALAGDAPVKGALLHAEGFPAFHVGQPSTISGRITEVRGDVSGTALQIHIAEGIDVRWEGLSGSAITVGGKVVGVMTQVSSGASIAWGASSAVVRRLSRILDAGDLRGEVGGLLQRRYAEPQHLLDLRAELGWPEDAHAGADLRAISASLAARAMLDGAAGVVRLLDAVGHDHPASADVMPLQERALGLTQRPGTSAGHNRADRVREIMVRLHDSKTSGVAVLEPLGFRAREIVEEVLRQLDRPGEALLPVRFVPERRTAGDQRLFETLLRDLRWAVPDPWRAVVDVRQDPSAMDRFEYGVEELLKGPVRESSRTLLFVVEGLGRVPKDQLEQWGYLMSRLSKHALKLLVWGGKELHDLRTQPPEDGNASAFHVLSDVTVGALSLDEVSALASEHGGDAAGIATLHRATGGHPALVDELLRGCAQEALGGDAEAITERLLQGDHLAMLCRIVERDPALQAVLRTLASAGGEALPRGRKRRDEARLFWHGLIKDGGPKSWAWVAPVMRVFAGEW